jgi:Putative zincin peptidase
MFFIPGFLISLVTFPGIIVHELAHQLFCRLQGVAILKTCYFQLGNPAGYVVHEIPKYPHQSLLIGIGPFLVNTIVGALVAFPAAIPVIKFGGGDGLDHTLIWLGVSIAMHAFPSRGDAESMNSAISTGDVPILLKIVTAPIVLLINLAALGRFFWLDLFYGVGVAVALPTLLVNLFA